MSDYTKDNYERLRIELNKKDYYDYDTYCMYLEENGLDPNDTYDKTIMQKKMKSTVYDILQSLANNIELFMSIQTEFTNVSDAYSALEKRLEALKKEIDMIPDDIDDGDTKSAITFMYHS